MRGFSDIQEELELRPFNEGPLGSLHIPPVNEGGPEILVRRFDREAPPSLAGPFAELTRATGRWIESHRDLRHFVTLEQPIEVGEDFVARRFYISYRTSTRSYEYDEDPAEWPEELDAMRSAFRAAAGRSTEPKDVLLERILARSILEASGKVIPDDDGFIIIELRPTLDQLRWWATLLEPDSRAGVTLDDLGSAVLPPSREGFPLGAVLGEQYRITRLLRGEPSWGQYLGESEHGNQLITLTRPHRIERFRLYRDLKLKVRGVAELRHVGTLRDIYNPLGEERYEALVETLPPGVPSTDLAPPPLSGARALVLTRQVGEVLLDAHRQGIAIGTFRPELIYVDGDDVTLAPRCEAFFATAEKPPRIIEPCFEDTYQAPELLALEPATAAGDVFSLCAVLWYWLTGEHPFVGSSYYAAAGGTLRPWTGPPDLGPLLKQGLAQDPRARPGLEVLLAASVIAPAAP